MGKRDAHVPKNNSTKWSVTGFGGCESDAGPCGTPVVGGKKQYV